MALALTEGIRYTVKIIGREYEINEKEITGCCCADGRGSADRRLRKKGDRKRGYSLGR